MKKSEIYNELKQLFEEQRQLLHDLRFEIAANDKNYLASLKNKYSAREEKFSMNSVKGWAMRTLMNIRY
jgi:hypothetical protein